MNKLEHKSKNKIIASFLNIFFIGIGHAYIGEVKKRLALYVIFFFIYFILSYISTIFEIAYLIIPIFVLLYIYSVYDVVHMISERKEKNIKYNKTRFIFLYICLSSISSFLLLEYGPVKYYSIPSSSMSSTIVKGDYVIVIKNNVNIKRGDIVSFMYPQDVSVHYAKRIIAKSGDIIFLKNKELFLHPNEGNEFVKKNYHKYETIYINDKLFVKNPYRLEHNGIHNDVTVTLDSKYPPKMFNFEAIKIPENGFFMMGDNRDHSNDSRFIGIISKEHIIGKVGAVYMNFNNISRVGNLLH